MHETRLVMALADAVGRAAGEEAPHVVEVELLVGALAPVDAAGIASRLGDAVRARWGATPRIVVDTGDRSERLSGDVRVLGLTVGR